MTAARGEPGDRPRARRGSVRAGGDASPTPAGRAPMTNDPFLAPGPFDPPPPPTTPRGRIEWLRDDPDWAARLRADDLDVGLAGFVLDVGRFALGVDDHREPAVPLGDERPARMPMTDTVGLAFTFERPEPALFGFPSRTVPCVLTDFVEELKTGRRFERGEHRVGNGERDLRWRCLPVAENQLPPHVGYAMAFHRFAGLPNDPRAVQLVWPDAQNRTPGDPGCEPGCAAQPRLDVPLTSARVAAFDARSGPDAG